MLKKVLFVCCALVCVGLFADRLYDVYDFKCTFKRIEPVLKSIKADGVNPWHLSYKTVSDNLMGYIVVPTCCGDEEICVDCGEGDLWGKEDYDQKAAYIYVYRRGEANEKTLLFKAPIELKGGVFGEGYNDAYKDSDKAEAIYKKARQGFVSIVFDVDAFEELSRPYVEGSREIEYGFLGFTSMDGTFVMTGFGNVTPNVKKTKSTQNLCGSTPATSFLCFQMNNFTGNMVGSFNYGNSALCDSCDESSIFDPCLYTERKFNAVVNGTWTLKLNKTYSKKYSEIEEVDEFALKKLNKKEIKDADLDEDPAVTLIENVIIPIKTED